MKSIALLIAALVASASATYVIEWTAPLSYSAAYGYTSNQNYSYDITGDSIPELFVSDSSSLKVLNGVTHSLIWTIPLSYTYGGYPIIANTDGDANQELVFAAYSVSPSYSGKFYVYDCQTHTQEFASPVKSGYINVSVADIDGDNKSEICCISGAAGDRILEVYGSNDADVNETPDPAPKKTSARPFPNPTQHVVMLPVAPGASGTVTVTDLTGRVVRILAGTGTVVWDCRDRAGALVPQGTYVFRVFGDSGG
jgi:hypothetical protein